MTHYSDNPGMVRLDLFKPTGKRYMTEAWDMSDYYDVGSYPEYPEDAVRAMLEASEHGRALLEQFITVVIKPYHARAYPVMLIPERYRIALEQERLKDPSVMRGGAQ